MRPREFNTEEVLTQVMQTFWAKGYSATSMRDLVDSTGVHRASLYSAFGNKQALFRAAIDYYFEVVAEARIAEMLAASRGRDGIEQFFRKIAEVASEDECYWGCLVVNTAVELASHEHEIVERLRGNQRRFEAAFTTCIERAQAEGDIDPGRDPVAVARFLLASLFGLQALAKAGPGLQVIADATAEIISSLD